MTGADMMLSPKAHLQWVASALRRCIEMVPPEQLQVDLFVTHFHDQVALAHTAGARSQNLDELSPPSAPFRRPQHVARNSWNSAFSRDSVADYNSLGTQDVGVLAPAVPSPRNLRFTEGSEQEEFDIREYDLTHFDGEDQSAPTAAEMEISSRVRKEGKLRRAHTRKMTMKRKRGGPGHGESAALASQRAIHDAVSKPEPALPSVGEQQYDSDSGSSFSGERSRPRRNVVGSRSPLNPAIPLSSPDPNEHGYESEKDLGYSFPPDSPRANGPGFGSNTPESRRSFEGSGEHLAPPGPARSAGHAGGSMPVSPFSSASAWGWPSSSRGHDADLEARSADGHSLMPPSGLSTRRQSTVGLLSSVEAVEKAADVDDEPIDLDEGENADLQVLAELARPGHPKLDRIIREEVNQAQGCILVGACGPASLGTVLRSIVSKQIDPSKVWNGDLTGQINIVTEAYEVSSLL